jgi:tetratricopeptide (TPR) repeat protein
MVKTNTMPANMEQAAVWRLSDTGFPVVRIPCKKPTSMRLPGRGKRKYLRDPRTISTLPAAIFLVFGSSLVLGLSGCVQSHAFGQRPRSPARLQILAGDAALQRDQLEDAEHHYNRALALARNRKDVAEEVLAINQLGLVAEQRGNLKDAYDLYHQARTLQQSNGLPSTEVPTVLNLASVCLGLNDPTAAEKQARAYLKETDQPKGEGAALAHRILGEALGAQERHQEAEQSLLRSISLYRELGLRLETAAARLLLGQILVSREQPRIAIVQLSSARESFSQAKDLDGEVRALQLLAEAYRSSGEVRTALTFFDRLQELAEVEHQVALELEVLLQGIPLAEQVEADHLLLRWVPRLQLLRDFLATEETGSAPANGPAPRSEPP